MNHTLLVTNFDQSLDKAWKLIVYCRYLISLLSERAFFMEKDYMSSSEAAELLDVDQKTITNWVKAGHLIGFKHGPAKNSPYRILRSSVMEKLPEIEEQN